MRRLCGDRLVFHETPNIKLKGTIKQDTKYSFSKASLTKHIEYVKERIDPTIPVITFRSFKNNFSNPANIYFWNCKGTNNFTDKNIAIVGTPYPNPIQVTLYAKVLGGSPAEEIVHPESNVTLRRNGFEFSLTSYIDDEDLQNIQCYLIESELFQSIGRARLIDHDVEVKVFSSYPVPQAQLDLLPLFVGSLENSDVDENQKKFVNP